MLINQLLENVGVVSGFFVILAGLEKLGVLASWREVCFIVS